MHRSFPSRRSRGFSLLELMVTMALATMLIGMGAGVYMKMGRRTAATQAMASVNQMIVRAKNSSSKFPAAIVCDTEEQQIQAYAEDVVQELHFEPRATDSGPYVPMGIEGRDCNVAAGEPVETGGRTGGGLRLNGGSIDCGRFAAYDVDQGINAEVWLRPASSPKCELVAKGETFLVRIEGTASYSRLTVRMNVRDVAGTEDRVERVVNIPTIRPDEWVGIRVSYDRSELVTATNDGGYGFVVRDRWKESRRLAVDPSAPLVVANGFSGIVDDVRIGGVRSADPLQLPQGVTFWGANPPVRFADGRLDPAVHAGPARIAIRSEDTISTFVIGQNGTVLTIEQTPAPSETPKDGAPDSNAK